MDIMFSEKEEQMIFFQLFNNHLEDQENDVDEEGSHEEFEMRQMEKELSKIWVKSLKIGWVAFTKEYINI